MAWAAGKARLLLLCISSQASAHAACCTHAATHALSTCLKVCTDAVELSTLFCAPVAPPTWKYAFHPTGTVRPPAHLPPGSGRVAPTWNCAATHPRTTHLELCAHPPMHHPPGSVRAAPTWNCAPNHALPTWNCAATCAPPPTWKCARSTSTSFFILGDPAQLRAHASSCCRNYGAGAAAGEGEERWGGSAWDHVEPCVHAESVRSTPARGPESAAIGTL